MTVKCEKCGAEFDWEQRKPEWKQPKLCNNCRFGLRGHKKMAKPKPRE